MVENLDSTVLVFFYTCRVDDPGFDYTKIMGGEGRKDLDLVLMVGFWITAA